METFANVFYFLASAAFAVGAYNLAYSTGERSVKRRARQIRRGVAACCVACVFAGVGKAALAVDALLDRRAVAQTLNR